MKRFTMKSKHWGLVVVTVDDQDAPHLRNHVWTCSGTNTTPSISRRVNGVTTPLSHVLMEPKHGEFVSHENGCQLDFRRGNLKVLKRKKQAA